MPRRTLISAMALTAAVSAHAAPEWVALPHSIADASFIDRSSITLAGPYVGVNILRNFDETIVLGNDSQTGAPMYGHRSVQLSFVVDCDSQHVALAKWKLFDGNFGNGEVLWADTNWGEPHFVRVADDESRAVMASACAAALALRQSELLLTASND